MAINIVVIIKKNEVYLYIWMYSKIQSGYEIKIKQIDHVGIGMRRSRKILNFLL